MGSQSLVRQRWPKIQTLLAYFHCIEWLRLKMHWQDANKNTKWNGCLIRIFDSGFMGSQSWVKQHWADHEYIVPLVSTLSHFYENEMMLSNMDICFWLHGKFVMGKSALSWPIIPSMQTLFLFSLNVQLSDWNKLKVYVKETKTKIHNEVVV